VTGSIRVQSLQSIETNSRQKLKIIHQNAQYLSNKTELFTAFLQSTTPDILAISEHGLKDDEIIQCILEGYTVASHFSRKDQKGGGIAIYSSRNIQ
jgi:exonuclease III